MRIINIVFIDFPKWTIFWDIPTIWIEGSITLYWEKPLIKWHACVCKGVTKWDQYSLKCNIKIFFFFFFIYKKKWKKLKKTLLKKTTSCQKGTKQPRKYKENSKLCTRKKGFYKHWQGVTRCASPSLKSIK